MRANSQISLQALAATDLSVGVSILVLEIITATAHHRTVAAAFANLFFAMRLDASALLWVMSFLLFASPYGAMRLSARIDDESHLA